MTAARQQPSGREAVEVALLDAAADLLAERGPDGVSGRDIAKRAGVNYGLLHHYFGPKSAVLTAAYAHMRDEFIAEFIEGEEGDRLAPTLSLPPRLVRAIAFVELSKSANVTRDPSFPALRRELAVLSERFGPDADEVDVRARAAVWAAAQFGWVIFEDLLMAALSANGDRAAIRERAEELISAITDPDVTDPAGE